MNKEKEVFKIQNITPPHKQQRKKNRQAQDRNEEDQGRIRERRREYVNINPSKLEKESITHSRN